MLLGRGNNAFYKFINVRRDCWSYKWYISIWLPTRLEDNHLEKYFNNMRLELWKYLSLYNVYHIYQMGLDQISEDILMGVVRIRFVYGSLIIVIYFGIHWNVWWGELYSTSIIVSISSASYCGKMLDMTAPSGPSPVFTFPPPPLYIEF